jgi:transposase
MDFVGIDPAAESFTATLLRSLDGAAVVKQFAMTPEGFLAFEQWLLREGTTPEQLRLCIENTGVYSEALCYSLHEKGFALSLLDPRKVEKAFGDGLPKSDPADSHKIAEYGMRYLDRLTLWSPREEIVEQISVLLSTREQLVEQKTATQNSRTTLARKVIQTPAANRALEATLMHLKGQIAALEAEIERLIRAEPRLLQSVALLLSAPGVGWLLSAHLLVLTRGFTELPRYRTLAQYLGVAPNAHTSGTSVRKRTRTRGYGPSTARKLLHLAARSLRTHHAPSRKYFLRKVEAGKPKSLVLNNIANQLLRRLCAMLRDGKPYIEGYRSLHPNLLTP